MTPPHYCCFKYGRCLLCNCQQDEYWDAEIERMQQRMGGEEKREKKQ